VVFKKQSNIIVSHSIGICLASL